MLQLMMLAITLPFRRARVQACRCSLLLLILLSSWLAACGSSTGPGASVGEIDLNAQLDSASYYVGIADMSKLLPGRSRRAVFQDLRWRSGEVQMAEFDGKSICAVKLALYSAAPEGALGVWFHAIFVDDVLLKLVGRLPYEMEDVPYQGTTWQRIKPVTVGDRTWLVRALDAPQVSVEELIAEARAMASVAVPDQTDIGLTIAWLLLRPSLGIRPPSIDDYRRNIELRDQFNALRLDIGMTAAEVEGVFNAKPLEVGNLGGSSFSIFGSRESFTLDYWLHFPNVLVVFTNGKVSAVHSVSAWGGWRRNLEGRFLDLGR